MNMISRYGSYQIDQLSVGLTASMSRTVTETDIVMFAGVSGDTNPVHLDEVYASSTMFKGRIAHGMLTAGLISAVFGTRLPGPGAVYLSQTLQFHAPVMIGDTITATVSVKDIIHERSRAVFDTVCTKGGTTVLDGEATLLLQGRGAA